MPTWKEKLADKMEPQIAEEIDVFETQMALRRTGKLDEKVFAETRLRRGCYGQRYDNGHRHDGIRTQQLDFMSDMTKGPDTFWGFDPITKAVIAPESASRHTRPGSQ